MPTNDERKAQLQAELAALENEGREERVNAQVDDLKLSDVLGHLVAHSAGYPTNDDREVHARVVRKEYKTGEYAEDEAPQAEPVQPEPVQPYVDQQGGLRVGQQGGQQVQGVPGQQV